MHNQTLLSSTALRTLGAIVVATTLTQAAPALAQDVVISEERCTLNQKAGEIIFLTSFAYAATAGILDVLAAEKNGYFASHCLDVKIQPGQDNIQLVSAGRAQIAGMGSPSVVMAGIANGAEIEGIATYGNVPAIEIITMTDGPIQDLKDLEGHTFGYKGASFPQLMAMMIAAGVDTSKVNMVSVGYDPSILPNGQVDALMAYKSNEPNTLRTQGYAVTEWDPADYGVKGSFNTQLVNTAFAEAHPTAVADFLRASFAGFNWISESETNLDEVLGYAADLSTAGYDLALAKMRWQTEVKLILESQPEGTPLGWQGESQWQDEADMMVRFDLIDSPPDVTGAMTTEFIDAIYDGETLVWPAQ